MIEQHVRKGKLKEQGNDFAYWQTQSYEKRLKTIEEIRQEYIIWKYGCYPEFQRVYRIVKRNKKSSGRPQDLADLDNLDAK